MAPDIPQNSLVVVTGINGYVGSHVAEQLVEAGYRLQVQLEMCQKSKA